MPKERTKKSRAPRKVSSTKERRIRANKVRSVAKEIVFRCKRYKKEKLRCFIDTATGRYTSCISIDAEY